MISQRSFSENKRPRLSPINRPGIGEAGGGTLICPAHRGGCDPAQALKLQLWFQPTRWGSSCFSAL